MNAAVSQTIELRADSLTAKQEAFARYYVECGNATTAYRQAYNVGWNTAATTTYADAWRTLENPLVKARVVELQAAAAASTLVKARDILQAQLDVANADPNEVIRVCSRNCRHCWGAGHAYQWQEIEWVHAAADALDMGVNPVDGKPFCKPPSDRGGFGFDPQREPNPACPKCYGAGVRIVFVTDSDKLTGKARKLYKGVKLSAKGDLEVLMANSEDARKEVAKLLGAYQTDGKVGELGLPPPVDVPLDALADPAESYMDMVQRKR
jgi:phage terminase small subunit